MRGGSGADGEDAEGDALPVVPRGYGRCTRSDEGGDVAEGVAGDAERFQKVTETARQFQRGDVQEGGVGSGKGGEVADRHAGAGRGGSTGDRSECAVEHDVAWGSGQADHGDSQEDRARVSEARRGGGGFY